MAVRESDIKGFANGSCPKDLLAATARTRPEVGDCLCQLQPPAPGVGPYHFATGSCGVVSTVGELFRQSCLTQAVEIRVQRRSAFIEFGRWVILSRWPVDGEPAIAMRHEPAPKIGFHSGVGRRLMAELCP